MISSPLMDGAYDRLIPDYDRVLCGSLKPVGLEWRTHVYT